MPKTNCGSVVSTSPCPKSSHVVATSAKYGGRRAIPASMQSWDWSRCTTCSSGSGQRSIRRVVDCSRSVIVANRTAVDGRRWCRKVRRGANAGAHGVVSDAQSFTQRALSKQASKLKSQARIQVGNLEFLLSGPVSARERGPGSVRDGRSANIGSRGWSRMHKPSPGGLKQASTQNSEAKT